MTTQTTFPESLAAQRVQLVREAFPTEIAEFASAPVRRAQDAARIGKILTEHDTRERFLAFALDVQNNLVGFFTVSLGTLTSSLVHPREVFQPAILANAAAVIVLHNHPTGDPEPSQADRDVTRRLLRAGHLLGVPLVDHVIVTHTGAYRSMRECMDFEAPGIDGGDF